jgi:hypothetical protein
VTRFALSRGTCMPQLVHCTSVLLPLPPPFRPPDFLFFAIRIHNYGLVQSEFA